MKQKRGLLAIPYQPARQRRNDFAEVYQGKRGGQTDRENPVMDSSTDSSGKDQGRAVDWRGEGEDLSDPRRFYCEKDAIIS